MSGQDPHPRVIGLLTLAYNALPELGKETLDEGFEEEFNKIAGGLLDGWPGARDPEQRLSLAQPAGTRGLAPETDVDVIALLSLFIGIFARLCQEVEGKYPDADIPGLLQAIALIHSGS